MKTPQRTAVAGAVRPEALAWEAGITAGSIAFVHDCAVYISTNRRKLEKVHIHCLCAAIKLIREHKLSITGEVTPESYLGIKA